MGALTRLDLAEALTHRLGFSRRVSLKLVDALFDIIAEAVRNGEQVKVVRFGRFQSREIRERTTVAPKTGEEVLVRGGKTMVFLPSKSLKESLNGAGEALLQDRRGE